MALLYLSTPERGTVWAAAVQKTLPDLPFWQGEAAVLDPAAVRYVACWIPPEGLFDRYPNIELVISIGAGADQFDQQSLPSHVRIARMITPGITQMMRDYVSLGVLALHRDLPCLIAQQAQEIWRATPARLARDTSVGVMGLGELGRAALEALAPFGFKRAGLARGQRQLPGVTCFAGPDALPDFLAPLDILVCLLPLTRETEGLLDAQLFAQMKPGARLLHCGRGAQLDQEALLAALDTGQLSAAMLDVTTPEPLPKGHPLWSHPKVLITPHIASTTDAEEGAACLIRILSAFRAGQPFAEEVSREQGY